MVILEALVCGAVVPTLYNSKHELNLTFNCINLTQLYVRTLL